MAGSIATECKRLASIAFFASLATGAIRCSGGDGAIDGTIAYIDGAWDPATGLNANPVPRLLVHLMQGGEGERREIVSRYLAARLVAQPGAQPGLVDVVQIYASAASQLQAAEVGPDGSYSFRKLAKGSWLVFAEYTSDLGTFVWMERVEIEGSRVQRIDLSWQNKLALEVPRLAPGAGGTAPREEIEKLVDPPAPPQAE